MVVAVLLGGLHYSRRVEVSKYGVEEHWIVDPKARTVEVYDLEDKSLKLTGKFSATDTLTSTVLPAFSCKVEDVFADLD
jgi:Uma2 family endonuclease